MSCTHGIHRSAWANEPTGKPQVSNLQRTATGGDHDQAKVWRPFDLSASRAERDGIRITALESGDADAVFAMLGRCSLTTLYHRFHGMTDGISHATQVLANAADQSSYAAWNTDQCVGLASLAAIVKGPPMSACWSRTSGNGEGWAPRSWERSLLRPGNAG